MVIFTVRSAEVTCQSTFALQHEESWFFRVLLLHFLVKLLMTGPSLQIILLFIQAVQYQASCRSFTFW